MNHNDRKYLNDCRRAAVRFLDLAKRAVNVNVKLAAMRGYHRNMNEIKRLTEKG